MFDEHPIQTTHRLVLLVLLLSPGVNCRRRATRAAVHGRLAFSVEAVAGGVAESLEMPVLTVGALARGFLVVLIAGGVVARCLKRSKTELDVDLRGGASAIIKNESTFLPSLHLLSSPSRPSPSPFP